MSQVLGLVPARGGSKGLPGKNVRPLGGRPLVAYALEAARDSGLVDRIVLSTDSEEIATLGREAGLDVPFMRPPDLGGDETPMVAVIQHALATLAQGGWVADVIVLLQPTSPLRTAGHIRGAVTLLQQSGADSVVSVVEVPRHLSPDYVMRIEGGYLRPFLADGLRLVRRQDARQAFARDGTVYVCRRTTIERFGNIYGERCQPFVVDPAESLSIDTQEDWDAAERRLVGR